MSIVHNGASFFWVNTLGCSVLVPPHHSLPKRLPDPIALNTTYIPMTSLFMYLSKTTLLRSTIFYTFDCLTSLLGYLISISNQMEFLMSPHPIPQPQAALHPFFLFLTKDTSGYLAGQARNLVILEFPSSSIWSTTKTSQFNFKNIYLLLAISIVFLLI